MLCVMHKLTVEGYRSIRRLSIDLLPINVLTGPNGCGKSNLYNSLVLIARAAEGRLARTIPAEGAPLTSSGPEGRRSSNAATGLRVVGSPEPYLTGAQSL